MSRLLLPFAILLCMAGSLFAQQFPIRHEGQDLPELPISMSLDDPLGLEKPIWLRVPFPKTTPEMIHNFLNYDDKPYGIAEDIGDLLLAPADIALDIILKGLSCIGGSIDQDTITARVMNTEVRDVRLFSEFIRHFNEREQKFFAGMSGSYLSNPNIEDGNAEIDNNAFMVEQRKVMWDVVKKTYFAKYRFHAEERLHDDAFYLNKWQGIDFVALPPFLAGYLYYRGLDKHFDLGDIRVRTLVEPVQRLMTGDVIGAVMIDIRPKRWPIGIVGSMGFYDGKPDFEFIGIGSTIDAVKKAIALRNE